MTSASLKTPPAVAAHHLHAVRKADAAYREAGRLRRATGDERRRVVAIARAAGVSQQDVADALGVTRAAVRKLERLERPAPPAG